MSRDERGREREREREREEVKGKGHTLNKEKTTAEERKDSSKRRVKDWTHDLT